MPIVGFIFSLTLCCFNLILDFMVLHQKLCFFLIGHFVINIETLYEAVRKVDHTHVAKICESFGLMGVQFPNSVHKMVGVLKNNLLPWFAKLEWEDVFPIGFKIILLSEHH